jgi:hypothetical protein
MCAERRRARIHIKVLECNIVVCIWSLEQSLKDHKVVPRQEMALRNVRDAKEGCELPAANARQVAFGRDSINELFTIQEPKTTPRSLAVSNKNN